MDKLTIRSPRQARAVEVLVEKAVAVKDLGLLIGSLNPRQIILELRRLGLEIVTRRFRVIDRDGKACHPGEYYLTDSYKPLAKQALEDYKNRGKITKNGGQ